MKNSPGKMPIQSWRQGTKRQRPGSVTLIALGVLTIATTHLARFIMALSQWQFLEDILPLSPAVLAATGLFWTLVMAPLSWQVWRGARRARLTALVVALLYTAYYWFDRLGLGSGEALTNWPFAATVNLLVLGWLAWTLTRQKVKAYFGETHEPEPENSTVT